MTRPGACDSFELPEDLNDQNALINGCTMEDARMDIDELH